MVANTADNTPMCDYTSPSLTSVSLNVQHIAEQAIDAIVLKKVAGIVRLPK